MSFPKLNSLNLCGQGRGGRWTTTAQRGVTWHLAQLHRHTEHKCLNREKEEKERGKGTPLLTEAQSHYTQTRQKEGQVLFTSCLDLFHIFIFKEKKEKRKFSDESSDVTRKRNRSHLLESLLRNRLPVLAAFFSKEGKRRQKVTSLTNNISAYDLPTFILSYKTLRRSKTRAAFREGIWQLQSQCCCTWMWTLFFVCMLIALCQQQQFLLEKNKMVIYQW